MKGIVILIIFLCICAFIGSMLLTREVMRDPGVPLAVAYGMPGDDTIQIHVGVPPLVPVADPLDNNIEDASSWEEWVDLHFQLSDVAGNRIPLTRIGTSGLMLDEKAAGAPEFVLWAEVKKGERYLLDFVPIRAEGKRYRLSFTAPLESKKVGRPAFEPVPEGEP